MNTILASIWKKIATEALKAFAVTTMTVVATKAVDHVYNTKFKPEDKKAAGTGKKQAKRKPKAKK